jgi:hypothetical protein
MLTEDQKKTIYTILVDMYNEKVREKRASGVCGLKAGAVVSEMPETQTDIAQVKMAEEPTILTGSGTKKSNPWIDHVKKVKSENPSMKYKDVLVKAKETYTKKSGGKLATTHDYKTKIIDPVATQDKVWKKFNQSKAVDKIKDQNVIVQKSSRGRKPKITVVEPESETKPLKIKRPKKEPKGVQSEVQLKIKTKPKQPRFASEITREIADLKKSLTATPIEQAKELMEQQKKFVPELLVKKKNYLYLVKE